MKRIFASAAILLALAGSAPAQEMNLDANPNDPVTGFAPAKWLKLAYKIIKPGALVGLPVVLFINDTPEPLTVKCGKWSLVGTQPYKSVIGNPAELAPFSITPVRTNEFDGYCGEKGALVGSSMTNQYAGAMNDADGNFSNATIVVFAAPLR